MNTLSRSCAVLAATVALAATQLAAQAPKSGSIEALRQGFLNPPDAAKPIVRWWWFGPAVVKPEILKELQQMKADGIGGAELAFVYPEVLDDPAKGLKNLPFLSPEMLDAVTYAQAEGRKLGLRIDLTLCSGWPYGGPATTLAEAATQLWTTEIAVPAGATQVETPKLNPGESIITSTLVDGTAIPAPVKRSGARVSVAVEGRWNPATATPFVPTGDLTTIPSVDRSRIALFFVLSHTMQQVKRAAVSAEGYVLDPFSHDAVATHLKAVGEPLVQAFGATPPYAIFSDSLEAYGADWTPKLPAEFFRRRGYDLLLHLPELVAGGSPAADKVRHDYGQTLTELVNENYLTQITEWAKAHGTQFRSQTYGEPAVDFSSQKLVSLAEGEGPQWRAFSTLRWASSANHVFGRNVTSGETFTWLHSPVFRATPLDMKAEADIDFIMGENQLIFHGWPYSAPQADYPGWSLYAAAVFNDHNPWHPVMPAVTKYIQRISWLLRQGEPANQVAILLPTDDAWAGFAPLHVTVTGAMKDHISPELMSAILSAGYNVDYIDSDAIESTGFGSHQILVIPPTDRIPPATVYKINAWIKKGGHAICLGHLPTLKPDGKPLDDKLSDEIPIVGDAKSLAQAIPNVVKPDLQLKNVDAETKSAIGFIRRKLPEADIYFVVNSGNQRITKHLALATKYLAGQTFNLDTGKALDFTYESGDVTIDLQPYESQILVFSAASAKENFAAGIPPTLDISGDWTVKFVSTSKSINESQLSDWTADPETLHYSGEAIYSRDFDAGAGPRWSVLGIDGGTALPGAPNSPPEHAALGANGLPNPLITRTGPGMHAYYDPPVREAALVYINGQEAGALWHPPYMVNIASLVKPGTNHIEIHVFNTALNAWSALPPHNYKPLIEKYGDRFQMQDLDKVMPISSGILGSIYLIGAGSR